EVDGEDRVAGEREDRREEGERAEPCGTVEQRVRCGMVDVGIGQARRAGQQRVGLVGERPGGETGVEMTGDARVRDACPAGRRQRPCEPADRDDVRAERREAPPARLTAHAHDCSPGTSTLAQTGGPDTGRPTYRPWERRAGKSTGAPLPLDPLASNR